VAIFDSLKNHVISGWVKAKKFVTDGGLPSEFVKGDGSLDATDYALDDNVVHKTFNETIHDEKIFTDIVKASGIYDVFDLGQNQEGTFGVVKVVNPKGGEYFGSMESESGFLRIILPMNNTNSLVSFVLDVYDLISEKTLSVTLSGWLYKGWRRTTASILSGNILADFDIFFGEYKGRSCIWIGEYEHSWFLSTATISRVFGGRYDLNSKWAENWDISVVENLKSTDIVDATHPKGNNFVATNWEKVLDRPTLLSQFTDDMNYATETWVNSQGFLTSYTDTNTTYNNGFGLDLTNTTFSLNQATQDSLDLADSALQSFTETDPTVPNHVKNITTGDISTWNSALQQADLNGYATESWVNSQGFITSFTDTTYTAGTNVQISGSNVISATDTNTQLSNSQVENIISSVGYALDNNVLHTTGDESFSGKKTIKQNSGLEWNPNELVNNTYSGDTIDVGTISSSNGEVTSKTDSGWVKSENNSNLAQKMLGFNVDGTIVIRGLIRNTQLFISWRIGDVLYLDVSGGITNVRPKGSNVYVRIVGYYVDKNIIWFDPDKTWVQLPARYV